MKVQISKLLSYQSMSGLEDIDKTLESVLESSTVDNRISGAKFDNITHNRCATQIKFA